MARPLSHTATTGSPDLSREIWVVERPRSKAPRFPETNPSPPRVPLGTVQASPSVASPAKFAPSPRRRGQP